MKTSIIVTLILFLFSFSETNAQQGDTLQSVRFMKRKSKQFIAKISTNNGTVKELLYSADSTGITLLDSNYQEVFYAIQDIRSVKIRRANASWYGAKIAFFGTQGVGVVLGATIFILGGGTAYVASYALIPIVLAAPLAVGGAIVVALINSGYGVSILNFSQESYQKKYELITERTQKYLIKKFPNQPRMLVQ